MFVACDLIDLRDLGNGDSFGFLAIATGRELRQTIPPQGATPELPTVNRSQAGSGAVAEQSLTNEPMLDYLEQHRSEMIRITSEPYHVSWSGADFCNVPVPQPPRSPHREHWIHVFVSPVGTNVMQTGKGVYPVGTVILKQKFLDRDGAKTGLYTGMRKREPGYNIQSGDWEFFTLDGSGQTVTTSGKIDSCMECHAKYSATDFVSRQYLLTKQDDAW